MSNSITTLLALINDKKWSQAEQELQQQLQFAPDADLYNLQAVIAINQGQHIKAGKAFQAAYNQAPDLPEFAFNLLQFLLQQGDLEQAQALCLQLKISTDLDLNRLIIGFWLQQGDDQQLLHHLGQLNALDPDLAKNLFKQALAATPHLVEFSLQHLTKEAAHQGFWEILGWIYFERQDYVQAATAWVVCVQFTAQAHHYNNLGAAWFKSGSQAGAAQAFQKAIELDPDLLEAHFHLGLIALESQQTDLAMPHFEVCLKQSPESFAEAIFQSGEIFLSRQLHQLAAVCFTACEAYLPTERRYILHRYMARIQHKLLRQNAFDKHIQLAQSLAPSHLSDELQRLFSLPYIYQSQAEIMDSRERIRFGLSKLFDRLSEMHQKGKLLPPIFAHNHFQLAYQGLDDRPLMEHMAQIMGLVIPDQTLPLFSPGKHRQIRVGFVSACLYTHSITHCFGENMIELGLSPDFEVALFHINDYLDSTSHRLKSQVDHFITSTNLDQIQQSIQAFQADVLIYTDIGLNVESYLLASQRLAPLQCALPGHPVTTGLPTIDYFISNDLAEPSDAQEHYSESLIRMPHGSSNYRDFAIPTPLSKSDFGWSESKLIYFCPMTLFKIHPSYDQVLVDILDADPRAEIWFAKDAIYDYHVLLSQRFQKTVKKHHQRIHFIDWLQGERFLQALQAADVILDSFGFGGGSTNRMIMGVGQPMVTCPGTFARNRYGLSAYRIAGLGHRACETPDAYLADALKLANDIAWREFRQEEILANRNQFFGAKTLTYTLQDFLKEAVAAYPEKVMVP